MTEEIHDAQSPGGRESQYVLALDAGTTSIKGVLFDTSGRHMADDLREYELHTPRPDIVELDPEVYWDTTRRVIRNILEKSRVDARRIVSLGITSQAETLTVLDADGRPLRRSIVWLDNRTREEAKRIETEFGTDEPYRITGQQEILPTWTATRILWLREHEPEVFQKAHMYLMVEDYLIYRLTGRYVTDRALNPSTLYYDLLSGRWWDDMLRYLGISAEQLPELKTSGQAVGTVSAQAADDTGLSSHTIVTTAPIDQVAGAIGAGNIGVEAGDADSNSANSTSNGGIITETTGSALALVASVPRPTYDPQKRLGLYAHASPGEYVLLPWAPTAGMVLRWFRDTLGGGGSYGELTAEAANVPPGAEGLCVLPHLSGAGSPEVDADATGVFAGITLAHGRGHFVRAILESIALMLRGNLELLDQLGVATREVRSLGGAAASDLWLQIKADVCQKDLLVMQSKESACLGVAMLSCLGAGIYGDLHEARKTMVHTEKRICPNTDNKDIYDAAYERYCDLYKRIET